MKRIEILCILPILLLVLDSYEASLIARGRSKAKKITEQINEDAYLCLDAPINLPPCNFKADVNDEILEGPSRQSRSLQRLDEPEERIIDTKVTHQTGTIVIYKIEGCYPSRLPFILPLCKPDDSVGKIVEVRRLFPFKLTGRLAQESNVSPPLVFPELDMNEWRRFMKGAWTRPIDNVDDGSQTKIASNRITNTLQSDITKDKRKKFYEINFNEKKNNVEKLTKKSKQIGESKIFIKFPSTTVVDQQLTNDRSRDTDSHKNRSSPLNRIDVDASVMKNGEISDEVEEKAFLTQHRHEFPYAQAIPYDAKKLLNARLSSEFSYSRGILGDPEKLRVSSIGSEFPYSRAIPYDPKKLQDIRRSDVHDEDGSFPLSSSRSLKIEEIRTKLVKDSKVVPFDESMLDAAKGGGVFPYIKTIPHDTPKIVDTLELRRSSVSEKIQVPRKHVKTYWDEDFLAYKKNTQARKDQARIERILADREIKENLINTWNGEIEPSTTYEKLNHPQQLRFKRRVAESNDAGDAFTGSDRLKIINRWTEFPYSKTISLKSRKLLRRSKLSI